MAVLLRKLVGRKPFVTARYLLVGVRYEIDPVHACPEAGGDKRPCELRPKDWRKRETGPDHPLRVLECATHACCFTVYPHGYGPYERRPSAAVAPDGSPFGLDPEADDGEALRTTKFRAVVDFIAGIRWPLDIETADLDGISNPPGVFRTQVRHIGRSAVFFGVEPDLTDAFRLETAINLGIPTQRIIDGAGRVRDGPNWRSRASEVGAFLQYISPLHTALSGLARQGKLVGLWGTPLGT